MPRTVQPIEKQKCNFENIFSAWIAWFSWSNSWWTIDLIQRKSSRERRHCQNLHHIHTHWRTRHWSHSEGSNRRWLQERIYHNICNINIYNLDPLYPCWPWTERRGGCVPRWHWNGSRRSGPDSWRSDSFGGDHNRSGWCEIHFCW